MLQRKRCSLTRAAPAQLTMEDGAWFSGRWWKLRSTRSCLMSREKWHACAIVGLTDGRLLCLRAISELLNVA